MIKLDLYYANVVDNNDEDKLGKLQIKILPEFKDIKDSLLPWARPFMSSGFSDTNNSMKLPENGANVWVLADKDFRYFKYISGSPVDGLFDYDAIKNSLGNVTEMSDTAYPNVDFDLFNDGSIRFHNRVSGDHGFLHNTGTYTIIDKNGYVTLSESTGNTIKLDNKGIAVEDSNGNSAKLSATGMVFTDSNGNGIDMGVAGIKLKTGDAITWMPNMLPSCLFSGAPHGGVSGGIIKLKGG